MTKANSSTNKPHTKLGATNKPRVVVIKDPVSHNTVEALEQLLDEAKRGEIIGLCFVAQRKRREYVTDVTGEAYRNPTFARGMLCALDDALRDMVHNPQT